MNQLLVLSPDAPRYVELLRARDLPELRIEGARNVREARSRLGNCNIVLGKPALVAQVLESAPRLQWVQSTFAGVDALTVDGLRRDYRLTGVKGIFGGLMSEYVFGWILSLERRLFDLDAQQRQREWSPLPYRRLAGLTLGLAGLGSIGRALAATGAHFGMRVVGWKRSAASCPGVERVYGQEALGEFVAEADYLVITLPSTPATRGLFGAEVLSGMRAGSVLMNVGRGDVVDEEDLVVALQAGRPQAAVLDVFQDEPLPGDSPLWGLPQVHVTPHSAADSFPEDIADIFCTNYRRFRQGRDLEFAVDFERGY